MLRLLICAVLIAILTPASTPAVPVRAPRAVLECPPPIALPDLSGTWEASWCEFNPDEDTYEITQAGRAVCLKGELWVGFGWIDVDGTIMVWWEPTAGAWDGRIGLYRYDGERIHGEFGWLGSGASVEAGVLRCDDACPETMTRR